MHVLLMRINTCSLHNFPQGVLMIGVLAVEGKVVAALSVVVGSRQIAVREAGKGQAPNPASFS